MKYCFYRTSVVAVTFFFLQSTIINPRIHTHTHIHSPHKLNVNRKKRSLYFKTSTLRRSASIDARLRSLLYTHTHIHTHRRAFLDPRYQTPHTSSSIIHFSLIYIYTRSAQNKSLMQHACAALMNISSSEKTTCRRRRRRRYIIRARVSLAITSAYNFFCA